MPEWADTTDLEIFNSLRKNHVPEGRFIGDGLRVVRRVLQSDLVVERVLLTERWHDELAPLLRGRVRVARQEQVNSIVGFKLHQGVMVLAKRPPLRPIGEVIADRRDVLLVALDGLANAENVGAVVRSCAAFGVDGLLVGPDTCSPWVRRAVRASMGGVLRVPIYEVHDLSAALRGMSNLSIYAAHIHGERQPLSEVEFAGAMCLVLGGEAGGVSEEVLTTARARVYIPMDERWDCLNVGAAAAVLIYEASRRRITCAK